MQDYIWNKNNVIDRQYYDLNQAKYNYRTWEMIHHQRKNRFMIGAMNGLIKARSRGATTAAIEASDRLHYTL